MDIEELKSNRLNYGELSNLLTSVSDDILDILKCHMGPRSDFTAYPSIDRTNQQQTDTEFTKDGISIIQRLKYKNLLAEQFKFSVSYIGQRVDNECHDGTTTAMVLFCDLINRFLREDSELSQYSHKRVANAFDKVFEYAYNVVESNTLNVETLAKELNTDRYKAREVVIRHQSNISSKGYTTLVENMVKLSNKVPIEDLFGQYPIEYERYESKRGMYVEELNYDIKLPIMINSDFRNYFNKNLKAKYKSEHADIYIDENKITLTNPIYMTILNAIANARCKIEKNKYYKENVEFTDLFARKDSDLIFVVPDVETDLIVEVLRYNELIAQLNSDEYKGYIYITTIDTSNSYTKYFIKTLRLLSGMNNEHAYRKELHCNVIYNAIVEIENQEMKVGRLYNKDEGGMYHNLYYLNQDKYPEYKKLLDSIVMEVESYVRKHEAHQDTKAINDFIAMYQYLVSNHHAHIKLAGFSHDIRADLSVTNDTFGSVISSLNHGFIFNGLWRLYFGLYLIREEMKEKHCPVEKHILSVFIESLASCIISVYGEDLLKNKLGHIGSMIIGDKISKEILTEIKHTNYYDLLFNFYYSINDRNEEIISSIHKNEILNSDLSLIQSSKGFTILLDRLKELLPKYCLTSNFISNVTLPKIPSQIKK